MRTMCTVLVALLLLLFAANESVVAAEIASIKTAAGHSKVVVCYLSTWAVYRPLRGSFAIENFDPLLCTHVVYAFAGLDFERDAVKSLDVWQDLPDNYGKDGYGRIVALKNRYPHLKISLAIGGWNEGSKNYSRMAGDPGRRRRFVKNASEFVRKHNFDGLDLDWEYPTQRGGSPADRDNFVALVRELRTDFRPHNLLLTSAIGAARNIINAAYDVRTLSKYLDYLHIMCYDYGGAWDRRVTANAPLHSEDALNVQSTIDYLIALGASPAKLVLGVPFYGRSFVTLPALAGRMGDPTSELGFQGPYTKENGFLGYNEICALLSNTSTGWTSEYDESTHQGIARRHNETSDEWQVVTYDSLRSVAAKTRFAVLQGLAGTMVWSVDTDDFHGECDVEQDIYSDFPRAADTAHRKYKNFPMLRTMNEAMVLAEDEKRQIAEDAENEISHGKDKDETSGRPTQTPNVGSALLASFSVLWVATLMSAIAIRLK